MEIRAYSSQFRVVGSTAAVDARDNTKTTGTGVPIYWLNGAKVANNYADFYDGELEQRGEPEERPSGAEAFHSTRQIEPRSYTREANDIGQGVNNNELRHNPIRTWDGRFSTKREAREVATDNPLSYGRRNQDSSMQGNFYALSPVFTVTSAPVITDVSVTSRPADGTNTFKRGERIEVSVTFNRGGGGAAMRAGRRFQRVVSTISDGNGSSYVDIWSVNYSPPWTIPASSSSAWRVTSAVNDANGLCIGTSCATTDTIAAQRPAPPSSRRRTALPR